MALDPLFPAPRLSNGDEADEPAGMPRRSDALFAAPEVVNQNSNAIRDVASAVENTQSYIPTLRGFAKQVGGADRADYIGDYEQSRAHQEEAARRGSADEGALAFVRRTAIGSIPDMALGLGVGGVGRSLARRTVGSVERTAAVGAVQRRLAEQGMDSVIGRKVSAPVPGVAAATPAVAERQVQDGIRDVAGVVVRRGAGGKRMDAAGRAGALLGGTAGTFPGMIAGSREELENTDQAGAAKIGAADAVAAGIGSLPVERILGKMYANPAARQAVEQGAKRFLPRVAKEMAVQGLAEGGTEALQSAVQLAGHKWVNDNVDMLSPEALQNYLASFVGGAVLGGGLGGAVEVANSVPGAVRTAGRFVGAQGGSAYTQVRDALAKAGGRARERFQPQADPTGAGGKPKAGEPMGKAAPTGDAGDLFGKIRDGFNGVVEQAGSAVQRFNDTYRKTQKEEELDARTNAVLDAVDGVDADETPAFEARRRAVPDLGWKTPLQRLVMARVNPESQLWNNPEAAVATARAMERYALGKDLGPKGWEHLENLINDPNSGVSQTDMDLLAVGGKKLAEFNKQVDDADRDDAKSLIEEQAAKEEVARTTALDNVRAMDQSDTGEVDLKDWTSGIGEAGPDKLRPIDRMNSLQQSGRANQERLADLRARAATQEDADAATELQTQIDADRTEYTALRDQVKGEILGGKAVFLENAKAQKDYNERKDSPGYVELVEKKNVGTNTELLRGQLLDLGTVISRQQAQIRQEGTADDNVSPKVALLRGLSEAAQAGVRINVDTLTPGRIVNSETGRVVMTLTKETVAELKKQYPVKKEGTKQLTEEEMLAARYQTQEAREEGLVKEQASLDKNEARNQRALGEGDFDDGADTALGAQEPPPGRQALGGARKGEFIPEQSVVSDVRGNSPYEDQVNRFIKEEREAKVPGAVRRAAHTIGMEIGAAELQKQHDAGAINDRRFESEMAKLQDPAHPSAYSYLKKAAAGKFDTAQAPDMKADKAKRTKDTYESGINEDGEYNARPTAESRERLQKTAERAGQRKPVTKLHHQRNNTRLERDSHQAGEAVPAAAAKTNTGVAKDAASDQPVRRAPVEPYDRSVKGFVSPDAPIAKRKAKRKAKANKGTQLEADVAAEAVVAKPVSERQLTAEKNWVNSVLKMMGIDTDITVVGGKFNGYTAGRNEIAMADNLRGVERMEVLGHELGHALVWEQLAKMAKMSVATLQNKANFRWEGAFKHLDPETFAALRADYLKWRAQHGKSTKVIDVRGSRSGPVRTAALRERAGAKADTLKLSDLDADRAEYELSMDEWMADNIGRALRQRPDVTKQLTTVEKLFQNIADKLRAFYDIAFNKKMYAPAPSVEAWVSSLFNQNKIAVQAATGTAAPQTKANAAVIAAVRTTVPGGDVPRPPSKKPAKGAPKGPKPPKTLRAMMVYVNTFLPPEARQILERAFSQPVVVKRLREVYKNNAEALLLLDSAKEGMEARIAMGYLAWKKGHFNVGPKGTNVMMSVSDNLAAIFKLAGQGQYAQRILTDIANGNVERYHALKKTYDVKQLEARGRGQMQQALKALGDVRNKIAVPMDKLLNSKMRQMADSGVPALRKLAFILHRPGGAIGERGYNNAVVHSTATFANHAAKALEGLDQGQQRRVMDLLQRQATPEQLAKYSKPVREAVERIHDIMDASFKYMEAAGVKVGYRKNFFPVQLDLRNERSKERLSKLLSQPKFEAAIREFFDNKGGKKSKTTDEDTEVDIQVLIDNLVDNATGEPGPSVTGANAPNFKGMNFRSMEFISRLGNDADMKEFASLQTKNPAESFARYIEPMVRRAEYARRFGDDGAGLQKILADIKTQGGTEAQVQQAKDAVEAAIGTYGAKGSPTIGALSPSIADRFSGPKTKSVIQGLQAYQNARLLPLSTISSLVDPMGIAVRTGGDFKTAWAGFKTGMKSIVSSKTRAELNDMLSLLGATSEMSTMEALNQGFGGAGNPTAAKVNEFIFKWNGLAGWTRATRYMALVSAHQFLLKHGAGTTDTSRRYLAELGVKKGDVTMTTKTTPDGRIQTFVKLLSPAQLEKATPESKEADARVRQALMQFVDEAILRPNSQQTPQWHSDPYLALVSQYKAFGYAIYDQIVGRMDRELQHGNAKVLIAAGSYVPIVIMSEILRDAVQGDGEDKDEWGPDDYLLQGADRSGLLGPTVAFYGDIKGDVDRNRLPGTSQLGPTGGQLRNFSDAFQGRRELDKEFESALPGSALYRKWNDDTGAAVAPAAV